jgi:hypothetical protein
VDRTQQLRQWPAKGKPEESKTDAAMSIPPFELADVDINETAETLFEICENDGEEYVWNRNESRFTSATTCLRSNAKDNPASLMCLDGFALSTQLLNKLRGIAGREGGIENPKSNEGS